MMTSPGSHPLENLRTLLSEGRFQEVLDRHAAEGEGWPVKEPALSLAVATAATRLGRLADGERLARSALNDFRWRADDDGRMRTLNLLGAIAFERGELDRAVSSWGGVLDLARTFADPLMEARASNNLASVLYLAGRVQEARSLYREALLAYQRLADRRGVAETCHNLAITLREADDLLAAEQQDSEALRHAELVGDPALLALTIAGRAETHVFQGEHALAVEELDRATALYRQANDPVGGAEVDRVRAERLLRLGRLEEALTAAESARAEAERHGSAQLRAETADLAAHLLRRLGRDAEARVRRAEAEEIFQALGAVHRLRQQA
jgi:tetratricopeptide (TPR) repeat protein